MNIVDASLSFACATLGALVLTPIVAKCATKLGVVDAPDGRRKNQAQSVPLGGGLSIAIACAIALPVAVALARQLPRAQHAGILLVVLASVVVLLIVGLIDDLVGLTGIYKLIGQTLSASLLVTAGFRFEDLSLFGLNLSLGDFSIPFSLFFCLGAINAFNLIDGADGLAASIGAVVCLTLGLIAWAQGMALASLASFAMSGALLGFLRYNAPPARVYLGDTGSMLIGWVVAAVAIRCAIKEQAAAALTVPVAICAIPILDSVAAIVRRMTTGQSVFTADRGHLHHALLLRGWTVGQTAALAAGLTAITCAGAIASYFTRHDAFALATSGGVIAALASTRVFGHAEVALLASHIRAKLRSLRAIVRPRPEDGSDPAEQAIQLQGHCQWSVFWTALREAGQTYQLAGLKLVVSIPDLHESFYAAWKRPRARVTEESWRLTLPLNLAGRPIGKLALLGSCGGAQGLAEMQQMLDFLAPLEQEVAHIVGFEADSKPIAAATANPTHPPHARNQLRPLAIAIEL